jgi:deoxyribodipyrimidine photolyase-related protein
VKAILIFPHQLLEKHPSLEPNTPVFLIEEWLFFSQYPFHKQKLIFHRSSMQAFSKALSDRGFEVNYISSTDKRQDICVLIEWLKDNGYSAIRMCAAYDQWLEKRIKSAAKKWNLTLEVDENPSFLLNTADHRSIKKTRGKYFQTDFYIAQRKKLNILLENYDQPLGGKWSYDADNRAKIPKGEKIPILPGITLDETVQEAIDYINKNFQENPGSNTGAFANGKGFYPYTHKQAKQWLSQFFAERFFNFGIYEDAMLANEHFLFHSVISPLLNTGLLTPQQVVQEALSFAQENEVPLNSLEGFIRQIIGWREFIAGVYTIDGTKQRTTNYWKFTRTIPASFYNGTTGIEPIDTVIKKLLQTGYNHHIERLMVLGNFMLLCEFDPNNVYQWFMEMYIDAYDWVMVPNVYGMTQFADGGIMTTKPYISGSNYLLKMGDWKKGSWQEIWDGLFWRFMHVHRDFFLKNPRLGMLVKTFDKMPEEKRRKHLEVADKFLQQLDSHA